MFLSRVFVGCGFVLAARNELSFFSASSFLPVVLCCSLVGFLRPWRVAPVPLGLCVLCGRPPPLVSSPCCPFSLALMFTFVLRRCASQARLVSLFGRGSQVSASLLFFALIVARGCTVDFIFVSDSCLEDSLICTFL